ECDTPSTRPESPPTSPSPSSTRPPAESAAPALAVPQAPDPSPPRTSRTAVARDDSPSVPASNYLAFILSAGTVRRFRFRLPTAASTPAISEQHGGSDPRTIPPDGAR